MRLLSRANKLKRVETCLFKRITGISTLIIGGDSRKCWHNQSESELGLFLLTGRRILRGEDRTACWDVFPASRDLGKQNGEEGWPCLVLRQWALNLCRAWLNLALLVPQPAWMGCEVTC